MIDKSTGIERFYQYAKKTLVKKGHYIFNGNSPADRDFAFLLDNGLCALTGITADGEEKIFLYFRQKRIIGFAQLMPNAVRDKTYVHSTNTFSIIAKTDCLVYKLSGKKFLELLENDSTFSKFMIDVLSQNYMEILNRYYQIEEEPTLTRLCRLLLEYSTVKDNMLCLPSFFTYNELAKYLGTHQVTIARIMGKLKQEGCISKQGKTTIILDAKKIKKLIDNKTHIDY